MNVLAAVPRIAQDPFEAKVWIKVRTLTEEAFGKELLVSNAGDALGLPPVFRVRRLAKARAASPAAQRRLAADLALALRLRGLAGAPGLARVYGLWQDAACVYVALEHFAEGELLPVARRRAGEGEGEGRRALVAGLFEALAALHGAGLAGLDLSPEAFAARADGSPLLARFGWARNPAYLAPEVAKEPPRSAEAARRADVFHLATTSLALLCGDWPFGPGGLRQADAHAVLAERCGDLADDALAPLAALLAASPEARPSAAQALAFLRQARRGEGALSPESEAKILDQSEWCEPAAVLCAAN